MPIQIRGSVQVEAPREQVWQMLFDAQTLKQIISKVPGISVERFEQVSETEYDGTALVSVAMVKGRYDGKITVLEQRPSEYVKFHAQGMGGGNRASGEVTLALAEQLEKTVLSYDAQGNLSGPLANLSQRLVDSIGRQFIDQGAQALAGELAARQRERIEEPAVATPAFSQPTRELSNWAVLVIALALFLFFGLIWVLITFRFAT